MNGYTDYPPEFYEVPYYPYVETPLEPGYGLPYPVITPYEQIVEMEPWFPLVPEAGYEYYDPAYGITQFPDEYPRETSWSLWDELKRLAKPVLYTGERLFKIYLTGEADPNSLINQMETPLKPGYGLPMPEKKDFLPYTPYPRSDSGTSPAPISIGGVGGISPMILVGAALLMFLMMKGKK